MNLFRKRIKGSGVNFFEVVGMNMQGARSEDPKKDSGFPKYSPPLSESRSVFGGPTRHCLFACLDGSRGGRSTLIGTATSVWGFVR